MGWASGSYTRAQNFSADASASVSILASRFDSEFNDFASAVTVLIARDGQNTATANLPIRGRRFLNVGAAALDTSYVRCDHHVRDVPIFAEDANVANTTVRVVVSTTYATVSATQAPPDGARLLVRSTFSKTSAACALSVSLSGQEYGAAIFTGGSAANRQFHQAIRAKGVYEYSYDASASGWYQLNPTWGVGFITSSAEPKCFNAAGTLAGAGPRVTIYVIRKSQDVVSVAFDGVSVSCSISAEFLVLSAPSTVVAQVSGATHNQETLDVMVRGLTPTPWLAEIAESSPGTGHIRMARAYNIDGTTVSANSTVQINMGVAAIFPQLLTFF